MAILIKDMEMPDSCFLCRFCRRQEYGEYVGEDTAWSCVASKKRITDGQDLIVTFKHPDCPLVEAAEVTDTISRQAAIDAIAKAIPVNPMKNEYTQGISVGLSMAETMIEGVPSAQPEQRWIPVTDHLPDEDVPVLVTDDAGGMATVGIDSCGRYEDTGERFWYTSQNVTAWMYTVEPYGGEQDEQMEI